MLELLSIIICLFLFIILNKAIHVLCLERFILGFFVFVFFFVGEKLLESFVCVSRLYVNYVEWALRLILISLYVPFSVT